MRKSVVIVFTFWAQVLLAQSQDTFRMTLPQAPNPPSQSWGNELVRRLQNYLFCRAPDACGGGIDGTPTTTPTPASTPTITSTPTPAAFIIGETCSETCADSGDPNPGALTITPACSLVMLTVNDANGCQVTLSETGATAGRFVWIQNLSANYARFSDQTNVLVIPHEVHYIMQNHTFVIKYDNNQWYHWGANDPSSIMLSLKEVTSGADVPVTLPPANECAILCAPTLSGNTLAVVSSIGIRNILSVEDPCVCASTGAASISVGPNGTCSASGDRSICIGDGIDIVGDENIRIGLTASTSPWDMTGNHNISIGHVSSSSQNMLGTNGIHIGHDPVSHDGDDATCIGSQITCDADFGVCYGYGCVNQDHDFTVGSDVEPLHPVWPGDPPTPSACGTTPIVNSDASDVGGKFTVGSGGGITSCTLTFARTWAKEPTCHVENESQILLMRVVTTTSTLVVDTAGDLTDDVLKYSCDFSPE